jgi:hypothetical protein
VAERKSTEGHGENGENNSFEFFILSAISCSTKIAFSNALPLALISVPSVSAHRHTDVAKEKRAWGWKSKTPIQQKTIGLSAEKKKQTSANPTAFLRPGRTNHKLKTLHTCCGRSPDRATRLSGDLRTTRTKTLHTVVITSLVYACIFCNQSFRTTIHPEPLPLLPSHARQEAGTQH